MVIASKPSCCSWFEGCSRASDRTDRISFHDPQWIAERATLLHLVL